VGSPSWLLPRPRAMGQLQRPMASGLLGLAFTWAVAAAAGQHETWYMVDAPSVVCAAETPPAPGIANITVPLDSIRAANLQDLPHVFTFYRTTKRATSVTFKVLDSKGRAVVKENTVTLRELSRRLGAAESGGGEAAPRVLRGVGGRGGGFGGRSSSRSSSGGSRSRSFSSPRRRAPASSSARRRVGSTSRSDTASLSHARRRGAPARTNLPSTGVGGSHHQNAYGQSYGFTRPQAMKYYYPGGYSKTGYGYSGVNSYSPTAAGSTANVMMAVAGGAALGVGASYLYSRWNSYDSCTSGASWTGSCQGCYAKYSPSSCQFGPPRVNAHRDDLMGTGFWPDDWAGPLTVLISRVEGEDFSKELLCRHPVANASKLHLTRPAVRGADLFFTLTQVDELGPGMDQATTFQFGGLVPLVLVCFCCICCGVAAKIHGSIQKAKEHQQLGDEDERFAPGHQPVVMGAPVGMLSPVDEGDGTTDGFLGTMAPCGVSWRKYCESHSVETDPNTGMLIGAWGECLAWAKVFEAENEDWPDYPQYAIQGPCGEVVDAVVDAASGSDEDYVGQAAERLERACQAAIAAGTRLPVIDHAVGAE